MTLQDNFNGQVLTQPGSLTQINSTALNVIQPGYSGVVAVIGSTMQGQPKTPILITSPGQLKSLLGSGNAYDAARAVFSPSSQIIEGNPVRPQLVYVVRADSATQAALTLPDGASANSLIFTSLDWGSQTNQISVAIGNSSNSQPLLAPTNDGSKLVTLYSSYTGNTEVYDNNGVNPILTIQYTGNGTAATLTTSATQLTTTLTGASDGSQSLTILYANYSTISQIANYINAQPGYLATVQTTQPTLFLGTNLDYVSTVNIKVFLASVATATALPANTYSNGTAGVGATLTANGNGVLTVDGVAVALNQRILVKNEVTGANNGLYSVTTLGTSGVPYVLTRVTDYNVAAQITTGTFVYVSTGTQNSNTYWQMTTAGSITVGTTAIVFTSVTNITSLYAVVYSIISNINSVSALVSVQRATPGNLPPANVSATLLTGGSVTAPTNSDFTSALNSLTNTRVNFVTCAANVNATNNLASVFSAWADSMQGVNECMVHLGCTDNLTLAQLTTLAASINDTNTILWFQTVSWTNDQGATTTYSPWMMAAFAAGLQGGTFPGTSFVQKTFSILNATQNTGIDLNGTANQLILARLSFVRYSQSLSSWACVRALTTYSQDTNSYTNEPGVKAAVNYTVYNIRTYIQSVYLGLREVTSDGNSLANSIKNSIVAYGVILAQPPLQVIVSGTQIVNGQLVTLPALYVVSVTINNDIATLTYAIRPIQSINFINHTVSLQPTQSVSTS